MSIFSTNYVSRDEALDMIRKVEYYKCSVPLCDMEIEEKLNKYAHERLDDDMIPLQFWINYILK